MHGLALESVTANYFLKKPMVQKTVGDLAWERVVTLGLTMDRIDEFQEKKYGLYIEFHKKLRAFWTKKSHLIITPSIYLKGIITKWGASADRISVIYNAVQNMEPARTELPEPFQQAGRGRKIIVSVGRLVPWKGFEGLIMAVNNIQEASLIIIGEGPEREKIESLIRGKKLQDRIHLTGMLSRNEVFSCLKKSDLFVLNSSYEGLPHIVLEAMAAGVPVLATDAGGTAELVRDGCNGILVPPSEPELLEGSIKKLLNDDEFRHNMVQEGFETLKDFSWKNLADQTEQVLENAVKEKDQLRENFSNTHCSDPLPVLFISTTRYSTPPDPTLIKKWKGLKPYFKATVISFREGSGSLRPVLEGSQWILLPSTLPRFLRYFLHFSASFFLCLNSVIRKKHAAIVAQSPYEAMAPALALLPWHLAGALSRPRLIIEIHSDWKEGVMLYHRWFLSWIEKAFRLIIGCFSLSQADSYRAISGYCSRLLPQSRKPVFIFPTFTDLSSFIEPSKEAVKRVSEEHGKGFFLFAGMLIYLKGVHYLIKAFSAVLARYPGAKLFIAGRGEEEKHLKSLAKDLGIGSSVCFIGHCDQQTLCAYIKNSIALVLPSLTEGLGRVAIEAHLLERPVVASRVGGIPEIVSDGKTGLLFKPGDEGSLSNALIKLLDDAGLADAMGKAGREAVMKKFNYSGYFESYYEMVKETCRK